MTSVDTGVLAVTIEGFQAPAKAKGFAAPGSADAARPVASAEGKTAGGPSSFLAALRSAGNDGPTGPAILTASLSTAAEPAQTGVQSISAIDPGVANAADIEAPEDGAAVKNEAIVSIEPLGMLWNGAVRIHAPAEACAASAAGKVPADSESHAAGSEEGTEGLEHHDRLKTSLAAPAAEDAGRSRAASAVLSRQAFEAFSTAKMEGASGGDGLEVRGETAEEIGSSPVASGAAPDKADAPGEGAQPEPVETPTAGRSAPVARRATGVAQPNGREVPAATAGAVPSPAAADPLPESSAAEAAAVHLMAQRTPHSRGAVNGHSAPEPPQPTQTPPDSRDVAPEQRSADAKDSGDLRQAADEFIPNKMTVGGKSATIGKEAFPESLATISRDAQLSAAAERIAEKAGDGSPVAHDKEAVGGSSGRAGVFDQIVQRSAVHLRDNQGEINIDLKPEFLGRVRMQISAENQQVAVRIITELSTVRDLIETGLAQLKSELQSQGLQVERLEVAVADEHRQRDWQQSHGPHGWKGVIGSAVPAEDPAPAQQRYEPVNRRPLSAGGKPSIDMFV